VQDLSSKSAKAIASSTLRRCANARTAPESTSPVTLSPVMDAQGKITACSVIARDITVRKDAEKHLEQMEGRYRGLLEAAPDGM